MNKQHLVASIMSLGMVASLGAPVHASSRAHAKGAPTSAIKATQASAAAGAPRRTARLVRIKHGPQEGQLTASPVRAKAAAQRQKSARAVQAAQDRRLLNAAPILSAVVTFGAAYAEFGFIAGAGAVATLITSFFWGIAKGFDALERRDARQAAAVKALLKG